MQRSCFSARKASTMSTQILYSSRDFGPGLSIRFCQVSWNVEISIGALSLSCRKICFSRAFLASLSSVVSSGGGGSIVSSSWMSSYWAVVWGKGLGIIFVLQLLVAQLDG